MSTLPSPVVILGAGFIGAPLASQLAEAGVRVRALTRTGEWRAEAPPEGVDVRALDLVAASASELAEALSGTAAVVAAYATGGTQDRRALYVDGARKLAAAVADAGVQRLVYCSSTSALPDVDGAVDEDVEAWPGHERGDVQREAEQLLREALGARVIVLRLAGLYGPGRELGKLYLRRPEAVQRGHGWTATNLIHRDDAVQALQLALDLEPTHLRDDGLIIHVCDDDHRPRREMLDRLAARAGLPEPTWETERPDGPPMGKRVANDRMKSVLGLTLAHPSHDPAAET